MSNAVGRPPKYRKSMCETALVVLKAGRSKAALAAELDVSKETIYAWEKEHSEFSDAIARGLAAAEMVWEEQRRDDVHPHIWSLTMKNRFKWTDKQESTLVGEGFVLVQNLAGNPKK
ncbi:MAG: helix-turn-helix domain-containing protein [Candidatus Competibacter denitrificans]